MRLIVLTMAAAIGGQPATAADRPFDRAVAAIEARVTAIDAIPNVIPGRAIIFVEAGRTPVIDVRGVTRAEGGKTATPDTPFYIASMTKAFVGLLAIRLDEDGVMPLDTTLADAFPTMRVDGVDLGKLTMRQLLHHQGGFTARALNFRTAYTDTVDIDDYPQLVALTQAPADAKFQYSNLSYLLYAAALEKKTKRSWKYWLDQRVLGPMGMRHSSARSSVLRHPAWGHERVGEHWRMLPPKADAIMHAAGGMYVSPADMARFLAEQAGGGDLLSPATLAKAQGGDVAIDVSEGPMKCTGYSFGWMRCAAFGENFLTHTGEYAGQRSVMLVMPARRAAFAAMFNSDSMTGGLGQQLALAFVAAMAGKLDGLPDPAGLADRYRQMAETYRTNRTHEEQVARARPEWGGWRWTPTAAELSHYRGRYRNAAYGEIVVAARRGRLESKLNGRSIVLTPAVRDRFAATLTSYDNLLPLLFERDGQGRVIAVTAGEFRFERVAAVGAR